MSPTGPTSGSYTWQEPEYEETVTEEEWEEERNGVMVKVRKRTTKRTKKVPAPTKPWDYSLSWSRNGLNDGGSLGLGNVTSVSTNTISKPSVMTDSEIRRQFRSLLESASKSADDSE